MTPRERAALRDAASEGIASYLDLVDAIEHDPAASEDELANAVAYGVRADVAQRALDAFLSETPDDRRPPKAPDRLRADVLGVLDSVSRYGREIDSETCGRFADEVLALIRRRPPGVDGPE